MFLQPYGKYSVIGYSHHSILVGKNNTYPSGPRPVTNCQACCNRGLTVGFSKTCVLCSWMKSTRSRSHPGRRAGVSLCRWVPFCLRPSALLLFLLLFAGRKRSQITDSVTGEKKVLGCVTNPPSTAIDIARVMNKLAAPKTILAARNPAAPGVMSILENMKTFVPQGVS